jgi:U2-associated protein SR140
VKGFPDLSSKLAAPAKKSLFERQKAEAEAKRARERAETAAVYEDFVKSFEEGPDTPSGPSAGAGSNTFGHAPSGPGSLRGGPAKRHFTSSSARNSGPGSLGPSPSLARKRTHDGFYRDGDRERAQAHGILAFENSLDPASAFRASDDEEERTADDKDAERAVAKPTLYLSSLPPGTSPTVIKALIPKTLSVDGVKILPPNGQAPTARKSLSAIVTLAKETAGSDIDSTVSSLQNRYLGWGYYLSISRHLSSAAISSGIPVNVGLSSASSLPFGAKTISQGPVGRLNRAPPPGPHRGGFAPPSSYGMQYGRPGSTAQVVVKPPSDLKQLRLIHKTLENLLNYGPEFEALLMSRPEVQKDEKWAWLWDARSTGGVWYRWKLWDILTNPKDSRSRYGRNENVSSLIFESGPSWVPPEKAVRFEYTTQMDEFVSDEDYNSSDEEGSDMEDERRRVAIEEPLNEDGVGFMNPLQKAKLTHLLARLPTANSKLRRGDVARVTAFAIEHAGGGADEVVEMLISNVLNPFAYTHANPDRDDAHNALRETDVTKTDTAENATRHNSEEASRVPSKEKVDTSAAKLVGLYAISDILSSSSTSGVRHAWRYRQLFESALRSRQVFEHLGRLEKDFSWGRLKAEKWKRSVGTILHLWEGWCVFPQSSQDHFVEVFEKPPLTEEELAEEKKRSEAEKTGGVFGGKGKSRWKTVDEDLSSGGKFDPGKPVAETSQVQKMDIEHDGMPMAEDEEYIDGEPMSDIDGVPMEDSDLEDENTDGRPMEMEDESAGARAGPENTQAASEKPGERPSERDALGARKPRRPKAEDMFADSESGED